MFETALLSAAPSLDVGTAILKPASEQITSGLGQALPVAGVLVGSIMSVTMGYKFFKKITGART